MTVSDGPLVWVLNGPNLNMLGLREPAVYGSDTLSDLEAACMRWAAECGLRVECRQSNHEGELVEWIQRSRDGAAGLVFNPGAYTHTSIALHDALRAAETPTIEVHLSNVHAREDFRRHSYISPAALGVICGFGPLGYALALRALAAQFSPAA